MEEGGGAYDIRPGRRFGAAFLCLTRKRQAPIAGGAKYRLGRPLQSSVLLESVAVSEIREVLIERPPLRELDGRPWQ
ncbi:hypothetical protein COO09_18960 [Rhizorhabdus dicambivorans]|uniref:Uncharacterized protein n=1 Tax=Rhizorhabdus dicambivorans TaxID=1850238 RepID=A0A2A4FSK8_9SPHN|nr:hypothetical protein CMV14_05060 [Rhizorhabdus dicambivorans]PCE40674.1 hypothetical protein COO09_18960 [Rhizorhabdus dicambivorans]